MSTLQYFTMLQKRDKLFKSGSSQYSGKQPLKTSRWNDLSYRFKRFIGLFLQTLHGLYLKTISEIKVSLRAFYNEFSNLFEISTLLKSHFGIGVLL